MMRRARSGGRRTDQGSSQSVMALRTQTVRETEGSAQPLNHIRGGGGGGGGLSLTVSSDSISGTNIILIGGGHQEEQEERQDILRFIITNSFLLLDNLKHFYAGKL